MGRLLAAIVGLFVVLAAWYSVVIPPFEATDEISHFRYAEFLKANGRLPIQSHDPAKVENVVAHNPPLYYLAVALVTLPIDTRDLNRVAALNPDFLWGDLNAGGPFVHLHDPTAETFPWTGSILALHLGRLVSVVAGAFTVIGAFRIGRRLVGDRAAIVAALSAFLPSFLFTSATVHNDAFVIVFGVWAIDRLMAISEGGTRRDYVICGVLIALAGLSKVVGFLLVPVLAVPLILVLRREGPRRAVTAALAAVVPLALLSAPWMLWNLVQYGEPTGYVLFSTNPIFPIRDAPLSLPDTLADMGPASLLFHTFVLAFGYMDRLGPPWIYVAARVLVAVGCLGLVVRAAIDPEGTARALRRPAVVVAVCCVLLFGVSLMRYISTFLSGGHGRYLFPVLPVLMSGLVAGWSAWPRPLRSFPAAAIATALLVLAIMTPSAFIAPGYAFAGEQILAIAARPIGTFDGRVDLIRGDSQPRRVQPGDSLAVDLVWQPRSTIDRSYQAFVQLVGPRGGVAGTDRAPGYGLAATVRWRPGIAIADRFEVTVPPTTRPGQYEVRTGFYLRESGERLPVTAGPDAGGAIVVGTVVVLPPRADPPAQPLGIGFERQLTLVGIDRLPDRVAPGSTLTVAMQWLADTTLGTDYTFSLQLIGPDGSLAAQRDSQPYDGGYPTSSWQFQDRVTDTKSLLLPPSLADGLYRLIVVVYDARTGARLSSTRGDAVEIAQIRVGRG